MKTIWIFGNEECARIQDLHIGEAGSRVTYFKLSAVEINMDRMEGHNRPNLIVNLNKPGEKLRKRCRIHGAMNDAQTIDLY